MERIIFAIWFLGATCTGLGQLISDSTFALSGPAIVRRVIFWFIYIPALIIDFELDK